MGVLEGVAQLQVAPFASEVQRWEANWKLAVESVLEGVHLPFVHEASLHELLEARASECRLLGAHSMQVTKLRTEGCEYWRRPRDRLGLVVPEGLDADSYTHLSLFPHFEVGLTGGALVSTQFYWPVDATHTDLEFSLWFGGAQEPASKGARAMLEGMRRLLAQTNELVLAEDRGVTQSVQRGTRSAAGRAWLLPDEQRIAHFHRVLEAARG